MAVRRSTVQFTEPALKILGELEKVYGLRNIINAGIVAFYHQMAGQREQFVNEANGLQSEDPSENVATQARYFIRALKSLDKKQQSITMQFLDKDESRAVNEMLDALNPEIQTSQRSTKKRMA